jgi:hypothetical protein
MTVRDFGTSRSPRRPPPRGRALPMFPGEIPVARRFSRSCWTRQGPPLGDVGSIRFGRLSGLFLTRLPQPRNARQSVSALIAASNQQCSPSKVAFGCSRTKLCSRLAYGSHFGCLRLRDEHGRFRDAAASRRHSD